MVRSHNHIGIVPVVPSAVEVGGRLERPTAALPCLGPQCTERPPGGLSCWRPP